MPTKAKFPKPKVHDVVALKGVLERMSETLQREADLLDPDRLVIDGKGNDEDITYVVKWLDRIAREVREAVWSVERLEKKCSSQ